MSIEGISLTSADLDRMVAEVEHYANLENVVSTGGMYERIQARKGVVKTKMPWSTMSERFDLRPGELTVWGGESGSGKSMLLGQLAGQLLPRGEKVFIMSMEMMVEETVIRMCNQCAGGEATDDFIRNFCDWAEGKLYVYDVMDKVPSDRVLAVCRAVAVSLGATQIVIDSLTKCGLPVDGDRAMTMQSDFVDRLQHASKSTRAHIHLVAHLRKPERGVSKPSKHDVRGAGQITDLADNVVLIARNHEKEAAAARQDKSPDDVKRMEEPDCYLSVVKQRHYSWEGTFAMNYLPGCQQFVSKAQGNNPLQWFGYGLPWEDQP